MEISGILSVETVLSTVFVAVGTECGERGNYNQMQINRLFEIVYILLDKRNVTAKELAEYFEVSVRTIYRDVDTLSGAGIPIYMNRGRGGGIALLPEFVLDKTVITEQEKEDILASLNAMGAVSLKDMDTTLRRFGSLFGGGAGDWIEVDFGMWSDGEKEQTAFADLKEAILRKRVIRFEYVGTRGEALLREVEPLKLIFKGTAWYLYGFCRLREDYRFFKLKRLRKLVVTEESFRRSAPGRLLSPWEKDASAEMVEVRIKVDKEAAFRAFDDFESCESIGDGSVIATGSFAKGNWMADYIISYGAHCEVLEPKELRKEVKDRLEKILIKYAKED